MKSMEQALAEELARSLPLSEDELLSLLEAPPSQDMGDYALPCFTLAGRMRKAPDVIARELLEQLTPPEGVQDVKAEGPYLNFFLERAGAAQRVLCGIRALGEQYGAADLGAGKTVVIEFSSPNIAKHLGIHHLPSAAIGMSLCRLHRKLGYDVVGLNFLGDWGTGFGRLIAAVEHYGVEEPERLGVGDLQDLYVRYSTAAEGNPDLEQAARDAFRRLEQGEPKAASAWRTFKKVSLREFERIYRVLGIEFDQYTPESDYKDLMQPMIDQMVEQGVARRSDGALIVPLEEEGLQPCLVQKSDGASLYVSRDLPAAQDRWDKYHFDKALYVVGSEQSLYFRQLKAVLAKMGRRWADRVVHVNFGLIKFRDPETGQARVGSTRRGEMLLLEDVLNEAVARARAKIAGNLDRFDAEADLDELAAQVGVGAVIFRQLSTRRIRDVVFDWERILDFEGDTGPYVQYAHARLCSILRKAEGEVPEDVDFSALSLPEEWTLVRDMEAFPRAVRRAAAEYEPSIIASHLLQLCANFSAYYSAGMRAPERRVLCRDARLRAARLLLVDATRHVIRSGLELLGVAAPERM